jgi:TolA-binding protein
MPELERELSELRREVVEARNQAIKTDNQVKNLALDVKAFEKRFDLLEHRTRVSSVGVNVIIAVVILGAAWVVYGVRTRAVEQSLKEAQAETMAVRKEAADKNQALSQRLAELERQDGSRSQAEAMAAKVLSHLDAREEKEAAELMDKVSVERLGPLGREVAGKRLSEFKKRLADTAFKAGRAAMNANRPEAAVTELRRALSLDPDGKVVPQAKYALATTLYNQRRFDEAVPLLKEILTQETDKPTVDDARYQLGTALARVGQRDEAQKVLNDIVATGRAYAPVAKTYLTALEAGSDLPALGDDRGKKPPAPVAKPQAPPIPAPKPVP